MIYYNFDGIRLPKPVELNGYNYQLICSNKDELFFTHSLMISKAPFKVLNDKICFDSAVDYQFYTTRNDSTSWKEGSLTIVENDKATTTLASVIDSSEFLWTNEDIYRYNSDEIVYKKFKAEEDIVALKPKIKTNLSQDKYYHQDDENIEALKIEAESPDGGELSYQWYKNGEKIEGANSSTYKPIITEIGKNSYYCEITNNYQGDLASTNSKTIVITVAEALVFISEEFLLGWKVGRLVAMLRGQQEPPIPDDPVIPDIPTGVYDDEFPIEWNAKEVIEAGNTVWDELFIKISNLTPTSDELMQLAFDMTAEGEFFRMKCERVEVDEEYGIILGYFDLEDIAAFPYALVSDGSYFEAGTYALNIGEGEEGMDVNCSLTFIEEGVYDNYWPIEWNMKATEDNVKVYMDYDYYYNYGGMVFPGCPMDTDTYPYNYLVYVASENKYYFYGTNQPLTYIIKDGVEYASYSSSIKRYKYTYGEDETWVNNGGTTLSTGFEIILSEIVWTNTNVVDTNGEVKFEATEPVEVDKVPTMWLTKISNLTPTEEELLAAGLSASATYEGETSEFSFTSSTSDTMAVGLSMCMYADTTFTFFMYLFSATAPVEFEGASFPSAGLYYMFKPVSGNVDFTGVDINFRCGLQQYIPSGGIVITPESVTEDSITHEIYEDYYFPLVKISDALMTAEDIRASSMVYRDSEGRLTVYHTLGDAADSGAYSNFRIRDWGCATDFNNLYTQLISVSNPEEAGELYNNSGSKDPVPFPETGTYVIVPEEGKSIETIMKFVPRYYNGVELAAIDSKWHDRKTYPYCVIRKVSDTLYSLIILEKPTLFGPDNDRNIPCLIASDVGKYFVYLLDTESDDDWWFDFDLTSQSAGKKIGLSEITDIMWSNHDILNIDGTVYLKGTNPSLTPMYL